MAAVSLSFESQRIDCEPSMRVLGECNRLDRHALKFSQSFHLISFFKISALIVGCLSSLVVWCRSKHLDEHVLEKIRKQIGSDS